MALLFSSGKANCSNTVPTSQWLNTIEHTFICALGEPPLHGGSETQAPSALWLSLPIPGALQALLHLSSREES